MRALLILAVLPLAACGGDGLTVEGTLAEGVEASEVWVQGSPERVRVEQGGFRLQGLTGDTVELRFADADGDEARMVVIGAPAGSTLRLEQIWIQDDVAFPTRVEYDPAIPVQINGMRFAPPAQLPAAVNTTATLLAVSDDGDALIARPRGDQLPDLRVVITPGTVVRTVDGDPVELGSLSFGDSLRVSGAGEAGYVVATEVTVARTAAPQRGAPGLLERILGRGQGEERGRGKGKGRERGGGERGGGRD